MHVHLPHSPNPLYLDLHAKQLQVLSVRVLRLGVVLEFRQAIVELL